MSAWSGYNRTNTSPILKLFLSHSDDLVARVARKVRASAQAAG